MELFSSEPQRDRQPSLASELSPAATPEPAPRTPSLSHTHSYIETHVWRTQTHASITLHENAATLFEVVVAYKQQTQSHFMDLKLDIQAKVRVELVFVDCCI